MNLQEIVNRDTNYLVQQDEALFVISEYIMKRKGVYVKPRISIFNMANDIHLMNSMFLEAANWFKINK